MIYQPRQKITTILIPEIERMFHHFRHHILEARERLGGIGAAGRCLIIIHTQGA